MKRGLTVFTCACVVSLLAVMAFRLHQIGQKADDLLGVATRTLPPLLEEAKAVAGDIKQLREIAGVSAGPNGKARGGIAYAAQLVKALEAIPPTATVRSKGAISAAVRKTKSVKEWLADERQELLVGAFTLSPTALLEKVTHDLFGNEWLLKIGDKEISLLDWLKENHPDVTNDSP